MASEKTFELFEKATVRISLENKKLAKEPLKEACEVTGAQYHEAADELIVSGTWSQVVKTRTLVYRKLAPSAERSGSSSSDHSDKVKAPPGEVSFHMEPPISNYLRMFYNNELRQIEECYEVKIAWATGDTQVIIKKKGHNVKDQKLKEACDCLVRMYNHLHSTLNKISFDVRQDRPNYSKETLERAVCSAPQAVNGLMLERDISGSCYVLWGRGDVLVEGQKWIRSQLGIQSADTGRRSLSPRSHGSRLLHETANKLRVVVYQGDITHENADIIVNACNKHLDHGGGVSFAISKAGGPSIQRESNDYVTKHGLVSPGSVAVTGPGLLKCKYIVHAVGPRWKKDGKDGSIQLLKDVFRNVFSTAGHLGAKSVAIPAVSSGIYGVPKEVCAQVAFSFIDELDRWLVSNTSGVTGPFEIRLVNIEPETAKAFNVEFHKWTLKGRKVQRRHSFSRPTKKKESQPSSGRSADDMHTTPRIKNALVTTTDPQNFSRKAGRTTSSYDSGSNSRHLANPTSSSGTKHNDGDTRVARPSGGSPSGSGTAKDSAILSSSSPKGNVVTARFGLVASASGHKQVYQSNKHLVNGSPVMDDRSATYLNYSRREQQATQNGPHSGAAMPGKTSSTDCPICQSPISDPTSLIKCGHKFCKSCIDRAFTYQKKCPVCQEVYGVTEGSQPDGSMSVQRLSQSLPGYDRYGCYEVTYNIPSGIQDNRHPNPGQRFYGTTRRAYLPATKDGEVVLKLLQKAFEKKLIFTVGRSTTTGIENCVTWNDIHHKTSTSGGPHRFGYPDPDYLNRVKEELKAKGIVPD